MPREHGLSSKFLTEILELRKLLLFLCAHLVISQIHVVSTGIGYKLLPALRIS